MSTVTKNELSAELLKVISAIGKNLAQKSLLLEGKVWKEEDLVQAFQGQVAALQATAAAHATWVKAAADEKTMYKTVIVPLLRALRSAIAAQYGTSSQTYLDFGFAVPHKGKPSTETRTAALAQSRATRKARNTMGKKQKLAIKGVVQPVTAASAPSPSQPSPAPASSPTASQPSGANGVSR